MKQQKTMRLVESALLLAVAAVLSVIKLIDMPYGGSVTACSALPVLLIGYRYGTRWGLFSGFAYGLVQLLLGMENLSYVTGPMSVAALMVFDYLLAFLAFGLGGVFRRSGRSQATALMLGAALAQVLRYVCHTVAGFTVWRDLSVPFGPAFVYSAAYNATYMLPELLVTLLGAWYLSRALDVGGQVPARAAATRQLPTGAVTLSLLSAAALVVALVWDLVLVFPHLQNGETGDFILSGLSAVNWPVVGVVTAVGAVLALTLALISRRLTKTAE